MTSPKNGQDWRVAPGGGRAVVPGAALIGKAFGLLDAIGESASPVSAGALQARTGLPRATLYRILAALGSAGYVRFDPAENGYALGFRFIELAQNVWSSADLTTVAARELRRLRELTGETVYLAVPHDGAVVPLGRYDSPHADRSQAQVGARRPIHCTSQGKAILAHLPEREVDRLLGGRALESFTANTITDLARLKAQLCLIRARGFAIDDEEVIPGIRSVGGAILDEDRSPIAGISLAGPAYRLTLERAEQLGPEVAAVAQEIAAQLRSARRASPVVGGGPQPVGRARPTALFGTAPLWHPGLGVLFWADRLGPDIHVTADETRAASPRPPHPVDAMMLTAEGALALAGGSLLHVDRYGTLRSEPAPQLAGVKALRPDREGMPWAARALASGGSEVGSLSAAGGFRPVWRVSGPITALAWDHGHGILYGAAPDDNVIYAMGEPARPARVFSRLPRGAGSPSGLAVDREGRLWVALFDGWSVARLNDLGEIDSSIALPVPRPTGLTFGGADLRRLFITTACQGISREAAEHAPLSGQLLSMAVGAAGHGEALASAPG
ncbi:MAG TPA: IclR family transcriptional regulator C-terminal domain-containing protein [Paracoccaceae bacterium]|nr:IclR family transcriptional regulator C-terminal domain-containing protein [Paracoccaceae bacterium]